jgi:hypothetical protein
MTELSNKELVIQTLRAVCLDNTAPAAARAAAARTLGEIETMLGRNSEGSTETETKSLSDLSISELDAEIKRLSRRA